MNKYIVSFVSIIIVALASEAVVTPDNMYPTEKETIKGMSPITPQSGYQGNKQFVNVENGKATPITPSTLSTTSVDKYGKTVVNKDMDFTDPAKADKYFSDNINDVVAGGNGLVKDFREKAKDKFTDKYGNSIDNNDPSQFSKSYIVKNFEAESKTRAALAFADEMYKTIRAKMYINTQIQCYITRKINNSYVCPIQSLNVATYGGSAKDANEEAKSKCNDGCKIHSKCLSRETGESYSVSVGNEFMLPVENLQFILNPDQVTKSFSFTYIPENVNDVQDKYFTDGLVRSRILITGVDKNDLSVVIYEKYDYQIKKDGGKIELPINKNLKSMKVYMFNSYIYDPRYLSGVALYGDNPIIRIKDVTSGYLTNKRYFCPVKQFETDARKCKGVLKTVPVGASTRSICVPNAEYLENGRSPIDGGWYSEDTCDSICWYEEECVPTYRHMGTFNDNIDSSMYDLEYGCVDSDNNLGCTKEKCKALFEQSTQPTKEYVWEKDDKVVMTVSEGAETGKVRPKVDFIGEVSTNGVSKQELFNEEMKDGAYQYMINNQTFNVTEKTVTETIPTKMASDVRVNEASSQISFSLQYKPNSDDVDINKEIFIYPVISMDVVYKPIEPLSMNGKTYYPSTDDRIRARDNIFLIRGANDYWYVIKRISMVDVYVPFNTSNGEIVYKWTPATGYTKTKIDMFNKNTKLYEAYSLAQTPIDKISFVATSDKPWEDISLFQSLGYIIDQEGILFTNNTTEKGKIYDNSNMNVIVKSYYDGYRMHIITGGVNMSYGDILASISSENKIYDSKDLKSSIMSIKPDSTYDDDRVQLFMLGRASNRSVFMKLVPQTTELEQRGIIFMLLHQ